MKIFGWKSAGREESRPVLSRVGASVSWAGEWPRSYEAQVREAYLGNAVAQRAVRLVADGIGDAPIEASSPELLALVEARSGGQALTATIAAHLMLHGNAFVQVLSDAEGQVAELFALRPERVRAGGFGGAIPADYALRGGDAETFAARIEAAGLVRRALPEPGDLLLFVAGPGQFHLAIKSPRGVIHADAMLRRVVERPGVAPWPLIGAWRVGEG